MICNFIKIKLKSNFVPSACGAESRAFLIFYLIVFLLYLIFVCFLLDCENVFFYVIFSKVDCESNFVPSARGAERRTFFHAATRPQEIGRLKFDFFEHLVVVIV